MMAREQGIDRASPGDRLIDEIDGLANVAIARGRI
jgi:hypothetical protein